MYCNVHHPVFKSSTLIARTLYVYTLIGKSGNQVNIIGIVLRYS